MSKRRRTGDVASLTGGTGDVNPQILTLSIEQSAADTSTEAQFNLPVPRAATGGQNTAVVFEILKVLWIWTTISDPDSDTTVGGVLSTRSEINQALFNPAAQDSGTFIANAYEQNFKSAVGIVDTFKAMMFDMTDGAGHGLLVGTDSIYASIYSTATGSSQGFIAKIFYRLKNVGVFEYVGIVQSQQ